jgi:ribosome-associated heat shock protein Hsp15
MRIDKYLWCIRVYKSRSQATEQCGLGKVFMNNEAVKASRDLKPGDLITVRKGAILFSYKVKDFPKARLGAKLVGDFMEDVTSVEERKKLEIILLERVHDRPRGLGRPTKRERRDIDRFFTPDED